MADPFISEIKIVPYSYAPRYWAFCNGQIMAIAQNTALFSLLGTTFGGNGVNTFALPNMQGNVPIHVGNGYQLGEHGGEQNHTLIVNEVPSHTHTASATTATNNASPPSPIANILADSGAPIFVYSAPTNLSPMNPSTIAVAGGSQPHANMQPYLTLNFCIALSGIYPSRN